MKAMVNGPPSNECRRSTQSLEAELTITKTLDHQNLIKLRDFAIWPGACLLVLDFAEHGTLEDMAAARESGFGEITVRSIMVQVWRGVKWLHNQSICHRDLTSSNVLIYSEKPMKAVIADFGDAAQGSAFHTVRGTLAYMASEVARGMRLSDGIEHDRSVDMWATGMIAWRCLTAKQPPCVPDVIEHYKMLSNWTPDDLELHSSACQELVTSLLSHDPDLRPSAQDCIMHKWHDDFRSPSPSISYPFEGYQPAPAEDLPDTQPNSPRLSDVDPTTSSQLTPSVVQQEATPEVNNLFFGNNNDNFEIRFASRARKIPPLKYPRVLDDVLY